MATQEDLLHALGLAHQNGDSAAAQDIAMMLYKGEYDPSPVPKVDPPGGATKEGGQGGIASNPIINAVAGPLEAGLSVASGAVAAPAAGLAGLATLAANKLGMTKADPTDVIDKTQNAITYRPRTDLGKATTGTISDIAGVIPKSADASGQWVADKTGSPALGAAVNTGIQGVGMIMGGEAGTAAGMLGRGAARIPGVNAAANFVSDILPNGPTRAARRIIKGATEDPGVTAATIKDHLDAQAALHRAGRSGALDQNGLPIPGAGPQDLATKYGIRPTTAQVARSPGLAQLDRSIRNQPADISEPLTNADAVNRGGVRRIIENISGTPESREALSRLRDTSAKASYDNAVNAPEHQGVIAPDQDAASYANELAAKERGITQDGKPSTNDPSAPAEGLNDVGVRLQSLLKRPAMQEAMREATRQAGNRGVAMDSSNLIQQLHYAKLHIDGKLSAAMRSGDTSEVGGLMSTKNELGTIMEQLSPAYAAARSEYAALSAPINRADLGESLRQKYMSGMADHGGLGGRPSSFVDALRQPAADNLAKSATGFPGATFERTMRPNDITDLNVAADQLGREQYAQNAGRSVGSNTEQNLTNRRTLDNIGSLNGISQDLGPAANVALALHSPVVAAAEMLRGSGVRAAGKARVAEAMANPKDAMDMLLHRYGYEGATAPGRGVMLPMAVGSNDIARDEPAMADGGSVDPYRKSSFWDLVKQAAKEATGSSDSSAPSGGPSGYSPGMAASGQIGRDFDNRVDQSVAAQDH